MAWAYFDTSALVKSYVDEPGQREVRELVRDFDWVASALLPLELRSALRRLTSEAALSTEQLREVVSRISEDRVYWNLIEVSADVLAAAELLVATHPLRALDAVHVASAQLFAARAGLLELMFISADARQTAAAAAMGLAVRHVGA